MDKKIQLSETVMLIDVAYLNFVVEDLKKYFERLLQRPLQEIDFSLLITYLALDAGMEGTENKTSVLLAYDNHSDKLLHCQPSDLRKELDGVAFTNQFGEYLFSAVSCEDLVAREALFLDILNIVSNLEEVKKVIAISYNEEYGEKVSVALNNNVKEKEVIQFRMDEPKEPVGFRWEVFVYPVMQALGIKADEL